MRVDRHTARIVGRCVRGPGRRDFGAEGQSPTGDIAGVSRHARHGRHTDEIRWLDDKVGTYLVDQAIKSSGASWSALATMSTDEVLALALGNLGA